MSFLFARHFRKEVQEMVSEGERERGRERKRWVGEKEAEREKELCEDLHN